MSMNYSWGWPKRLTSTCHISIRSLGALCIAITCSGVHCRLRGEAGDRLRGGALGLGLMIGGAAFAYGASCGCTKAEILAVNDDGKPSVRY